jgi:AcrR family transcriptional regulator
VAGGAREAARRARTEVYRGHILEAAEAVFAEHGFEATKVQQIADQANLSMGTIYSIFPGKQELYEALLGWRGGELLEVLRGVHARQARPADALDDLIAVYVDYFVGHPVFLRMHLRSGASWALGPTPDAPTRRRYWSDIHALQADIFRRGVADGTFVDEDPDYLAKLFSVMDQVLLADWVARGMPSERDRLVARLRAQARRSFIRGRARRPVR